MLRKLATVALCASSLVVGSDFVKTTSDRSGSTKIAARYLMGSSRNYNVTHGVNGFKVNDQEVNVHLDRSLKGISKDKLAKLLASNNVQLRVRIIEDEYGLELKHQLPGGGPVGTAIGANVGYWGVHTITQGIVGIVVQPAYWILGPAGAGVHYSVSSAVATIVQPVALAAGVAGGIAGGVATGPV